MPDGNSILSAVRNRVVWVDLKEQTSSVMALQVAPNPLQLKLGWRLLWLTGTHAAARLRIGCDTKGSYKDSWAGQEPPLEGRGGLFVVIALNLKESCGG